MQKGFKTLLLVAAIIGLQGCGDEASAPAAKEATPPKTAAADTQLKPQQFATVTDLIEDFADFDEGNGTFQLISADPLHIQMAAEVVANDLPEVIQSEVQRVALYGVFRSLIHTAAPAVKVDAVAKEVTFNPRTSRDLAEPKVHIEVTREQALRAVQQHLAIDSLSELVTPDNSLGIQLDTWSEGFKPYYYQLESQQKLIKSLQSQ